MSKTILILGAGPWQTPYIIKAKEMGLRTVVTDWSENAFGRDEADVFAPIDLQKWDETLSFAKKQKVDAVFSSADIGVPTAAYISQKLNLPYHSLELARSATNKFLMREKAAKCGLPIPKYAKVSDLNTALACAIDIGYPVIVKPVDSCASRGVFYVDSPKYLASVFPESLANSFCKQVLIEEFMTGIEGSVEALITPSGIEFLGICSKTKSELPYRFDLNLLYPGDYTDNQLVNIKNMIRNLVASFEIKMGIIHVEIIVDNDRVRLIEFGLRGCGSNVVNKLLPAMTGFDIPEYLLSEAIGKPRSIPPIAHQYGVLRFLTDSPGRIKNITGLDELRLLPGFVDCHLNVKPGDRIGEIKNGGERLGYVMTIGKNRNEVLARAEIAANTVKFKKADENE